MSEKRPVDSMSRETEESPGFIRRYRLPILLALVAICLYAGSILYILFGRGQVS
ncbi:MAG: hypothetical protein HKN42_09540 [Granulosicoccus sp.]|nr:hypothetical protein [Granulosicoccus sp.]